MNDETPSLKPLFTSLCGGNEKRAEEISAQYPNEARVLPEAAQTVCERLLSYPVPISPAWFGDYRFLLFSCYADPCRVLDELDRRFKPEHVTEVFMSRGDRGQIGYGLGGGLVAEMKLNPHYADEAFEEAEKTFAAYRL